MRVDAEESSVNPFAFVSSFYQAGEVHDDRHADPLFQLREELDQLPRRSGRVAAWVAEQVAKRDPDERKRQFPPSSDAFAAADHLIDVLRRSDLYICILAGSRRGDKDHGSPITIHSRDTAVSYFEVELYAAAMYGKMTGPPYTLEGFDPGPRLKSLLDILAWAFPEWRNIRPMSKKEICNDVKRRIERVANGVPEGAVLSARQMLRAWWRARKTGVMFLDAASERRHRPPDVDLIQTLIKEYRRTPHYQQKLSRLWFAVRELMPASYRPVDVQADGRLKEFLPYWDTVLADWSSAASWHGWHGHPWAGTIAALNSQTEVRSQHFSSHGEFEPSVKLPPDGANASAHYNTARAMGFSSEARQCLRRAGSYAKQAIVTHGETDNLLAIRGSIRLRMLNWPGAISDFKKMLRLREVAGASPQKIADAQMHLGHAYSCCPFIAKGRDLLQKSVETLEFYPDDPNLARAIRKLGFAYRVAGEWSKAAELKEKQEDVTVHPNCRYKL